MNITLARIDDRLIHGQVTTVWSKVANAQRIIICNDAVYNDEVRRTLLRQAAPPGMKVNVVNLEKAVAVYHNPQYQNESVFYLFTNPQDVLTMVQQGVKIATLNIGGMAWRPGKKQLSKAVSLNQRILTHFASWTNSALFWIYAWWPPIHPLIFSTSSLSSPLQNKERLFTTRPGCRRCGEK